MKKQIITTALLFFVIVTRAQQPQQPPSIEDRLKHTSEVLQKEIQPSAAQQSQIDAAFKVFFIAMDKLHKENPPPPPPPPDPKVKEAMDKLVKERDDKLKTVLTEEQFKKYKEVEKKLLPPKPGGPDNKNGQPTPPPQQ
jgi:hypothetical protein